MFGPENLREVEIGGGMEEVSACVFEVVQDTHITRRGGLFFLQFLVTFLS